MDFLTNRKIVGNALNMKILRRLLSLSRANSAELLSTGILD